MTKQTYAEWVQALNAVADELNKQFVAAGFWAGATPVRVEEVLQESDHFDDDMPTEREVLACFGIGDRKRLDWKPCPTALAPERQAAVPGDGYMDGHYAFNWQDHDGTFTAMYAGRAIVTGHPTRESAIHHLERIHAW